MSENSMDFEKAYNDTYEELDKVRTQSEIRYFQIIDLERSNDKLSKIIKHQNILLSHYEQIVKELDKENFKLKNMKRCWLTWRISIEWILTLIKIYIIKLKD